MLRSASALVSCLLLAAACGSPAATDESVDDDQAAAVDAAPGSIDAVGTDARHAPSCASPEGCSERTAACGDDGCGTACLEISEGLFVGASIACTRLEDCVLIDLPYGQSPRCTGLGRGAECAPDVTPAICMEEIAIACVDGRTAVEDCGTGAACWTDGAAGGCRASPGACTETLEEWAVNGPCCDGLVASADGYCRVPEGGACAEAPFACVAGTRCDGSTCAVPACIETDTFNPAVGDYCGDLDGTSCCLASATCGVVTVGDFEQQVCCVPSGVVPRGDDNVIYTTACCSGNVDAQLTCM